MDYVEMVKQRQSANREILCRIEKVVEQEPDWRFGQILFNLGIVGYNSGDIFFDESVEILERMDATIGCYSKGEQEQTNGKG